MENKKSSFFAEAIESAPIIVTSKPSWKPRNFREYTAIWDDTAGSGSIYFCTYVSTISAWRGVIITALP